MLWLHDNSFTALCFVLPFFLLLFCLDCKTSRQDQSWSVLVQFLIETLSRIQFPNLTVIQIIKNTPHASPHSFTFKIFHFRNVTLLLLLLCLLMVIQTFPSFNLKYVSSLLNIFFIYSVLTFLTFTEVHLLRQHVYFCTLECSQNAKRWYNVPLF